ncbi:Malic enzyme, hydrogenosomal [Porphyridium purpureum]|uniref:Malic enzyme n=1 Tax=Porphyridium purpureum TaxID=35688 RepID=A0A5J4YWQ0_PORPP|nr:Malic enzyme, hydrogenosomal [Porphyridium purpureum]|eukprot:POR8859..scf209_3
MRRFAVCVCDEFVCNAVFEFRTTSSRYREKSATLTALNCTADGSNGSGQVWIRMWAVLRWVPARSGLEKGAALAGRQWIPLMRCSCTGIGSSHDGTNSLWPEGRTRHMRRMRDDVSKTKHTGMDVVYDSLVNRGTGFSRDERERLRIRGLVPAAVQTLENQLDRIWVALSAMEDDLEKYSFLSQLHDRNQVLFFKLLKDHFELLAPIVYTPTVGAACLKQHMMYRRTRGMWFSALDRGCMHSMVYNWPEDDIDILVVTDGSRILGLGDLGSNGMQIPIGKLALYCAGGGLHPKRTLPVVLDVGTNNAKLRVHPLYLGLRQQRLDGQEYYDFVEEWIGAVFERWPNVMVQFEDFANPHASVLLEKYRHRVRCFNDDIQSTGCITVAAVLASLRARGLPFSAITQERIVCVGAGSAGIGVCESLVRCMMDEGLSRKDALSRFWLTDQRGLLAQGRESGTGPGLQLGQAPFVRSDLPSGMTLLDVISTVKPTVLIGLSGVAGIFTEEVVREMCRHAKQPVVLPLSNPSSSSECTAEDFFRWTRAEKKHAIFASGSPFPDVHFADGSKGRTNQCNNVYNFPGIGLCHMAIRLDHVTDEMFQAAARRIASLVSTDKALNGRLFPPVSELRQVSVEVAEAVALVAIDQKLTPLTPADKPAIRTIIENSMWEPEYKPIVPI